MKIRKSDFYLLIFYLVIFLLPTQLGYHFWPSFSKVIGIRVDYLSPTIYFTDFLIFLMVLFWLVEKLRNSKLKIQNFQNHWFFVGTIIVLSVGVLFSKSPGAGLFGIVQFLFFFLLAWFVSKLPKYSFKKIKTYSLLLTILSCSLLYESGLAILQIINGHSINGFFYFLGERNFNAATPGIANASLGGTLVLRPYGTFPHPNVLAGFFLIVMILLMSSIKKSSDVKKIFFSSVIILGTFVLFITLSRVALLLWILFLLWYAFKNIQKKPVFIFLIFSFPFLIFVSPLSKRFLSTSLTEESVVERMDLVKASFQMFLSSPIFGVGINNFFINLPSVLSSRFLFFLQPAHNIFLLVLSETGILGFLLFCFFLFKTLKKTYVQKKIFFQVLIVIMVLGFFDHYFLTLHQGQLLLSLILGLCYNTNIQDES